MTLAIQSDSFWTSLPATILAIGVTFGSIITSIVTIVNLVKTNKIERDNKQTKVDLTKQIEVVHDKVNGKMELLIKAASDVAEKVGAEKAKALLEKEAADKLTGKEEGIQQEKKEQAFRDSPPKK